MKLVARDFEKRNAMRCGTTKPSVLPDMSLEPFDAAPELLDLLIDGIQV